ncbi:MAG: hypothetical protein A2722_01315 [Candidatus Doudnabacteria bacterium RIFCSPHIGHO2_01_FULL_50_11]|uniref:GtrA/DPMS transmembrane domain-containing protein n=1 Tax=Candidatus Doudnabacteria bacterium RIFCSPHIGHO2_01_FULL_50_11 TaxID=1817828 RepID=A0A1F5PH67_9BACT|nr:MAG: hypothetical protein A2722_01315 [Candidatus Doudnabacteria bacterium RIFCSPHIGHO2_01_FULL_50_11]HLC44975.1 GtrA family protein [Patescibacteria group bacterium]
MGLFQKYKGLIYQFARFGGIGFLNTAVDFVILNLLMAQTNITAGGRLAALNTASFSIALLHSYAWNKYWAFGEKNEKFGAFFVKLVAAGFLGVLALGAAVWGARQHSSVLYFIVVLVALAIGELVLWKSFKLKLQATSGVAGQFVSFAAVSIIGLLINDAIVYSATHFISPQFGFSEQLWANVAKAGATAVALIWNFVGYKLFVFKK